MFLNKAVSAGEDYFKELNPASEKEENVSSFST